MTDIEGGLGEETCGQFQEVVLELHENENVEARVERGGGSVLLGLRTACSGSGENGFRVSGEARPYPWWWHVVCVDMRVGNN